MVLRKIDSAASLLLYIYRFRKYFNRNADSALRLSTILDVMKLFGKNESAVRMALSRSVKSGMFRSVREEAGTYYQPTPEGEQFLAAFTDETESYFHRFRLRNSGWDKIWCLLYVSDPANVSTGGRDNSPLLHRYGFGELAKNIWISPYRIPNRTENISGSAGNISDSTGGMSGSPGNISGSTGGMEYTTVDMAAAANNLAAGLGSLLTGHDPYRSISVFCGYMGIGGDPGVLLEKAYHLERYVKPYRDFINRYEDRLGMLKTSEASGQPLAAATAVPLFYELGAGFFGFAAGDPMLPKEILPDWIGDKAAAIMAGLVEIIMPCVERYFKSIN